MDYSSATGHICGESPSDLVPVQTTGLLCDSSQPPFGTPCLLGPLFSVLVVKNLSRTEITSLSHFPQPRMLLLNLRPEAEGFKFDWQSGLSDAALPRRVLFLLFQSGPGCPAAPELVVVAKWIGRFRKSSFSPQC